MSALNGIQVDSYPLALAEESSAAITPMGLLQMAVSQGADIEKLSKLMDLQERWEANEARKAFNAAMAKFKANPPRINKNNHVKVNFKDGGGMEYDHATLDEVVGAITPALSAVGIRHRWEPEQRDGRIIITCILSHDLGHSERTTLSAPPDMSGKKNPIQSEMSTTTYLQRYTLLSATGMAASGTDNDGAGAAGLPDEQVAEKLDWIANARDENELKRVFASAYKSAAEAKDQHAMAAYIKAKDARKKELA
jgi:hypothetical protein